MNEERGVDVALSLESLEFLLRVKRNGGIIRVRPGSRFDEESVRKYSHELIERGYLEPAETRALCRSSGGGAISTEYEFCVTKNGGRFLRDVSDYVRVRTSAAV